MFSALFKGICRVVANRLIRQKVGPRDVAEDHRKGHTTASLETTMSMIAKDRIIKVNDSVYVQNQYSEYEFSCFQ